MSANPSYRMTVQRKIILEEIRKVYTHPSAQEVYEMVRRRVPKISLGTVYRALELLCDRGLIQKLSTNGGRQNRFDGNSAKHVHVLCVRCDRIDDLPMENVEDLEKKADKLTKYYLVGYNLEFKGICPECQKRGRRGTDRKSAAPAKQN